MRNEVGALLIAGRPSDRFGLDREAGAWPAQVQLRLKSEFDFRRISIQIQPTVLTHVTYVQFCTPQYSTLIPTIVYEKTTLTTVGILHLLHKWCRKGERGERLPPPNPAPPQTSESCKGWRPAHASASNEN